MTMLFSTEKIDKHLKFQAWSDITYDRFVPTEREKPINPAFNATLEGKNYLDLFITKLSYDSHRLKTTPRTIRRHGKQDFLTVNMVLSGSVQCGQYGRTTHQSQGDITIFDNSAPLVLIYPEAGSTLLIELPRARLEQVLGHAALFATLNVDGNQTGAALSINYFCELMRRSDAADNKSIERLVPIGIDLLIASIAETTSKFIESAPHHQMILHRAKFYIENNLENINLHPELVANAMKVSLRYLQSIFKKHNMQLSDWIWDRRLARAAERLADPLYNRHTLGNLAYSCGFANQSHFSRRFRDRFGTSPTEYKQAVLSAKNQIFNEKR